MGPSSFPATQRAVIALFLSMCWIYCPEAIQRLLGQVHSLLDHQGKLCLITLNEGYTLLSRAIIRLWQGVRCISPSLVGGCRPLQILPYLSREHWQIEFDQTVSAAGVPSEIVVARKK